MLLRKRRLRGIVAPFTALIMPILLAIFGLVYDGGRIYALHTKLSAAVDAASIAGARAVARGESEARAAAEKFFKANIPADYFNSDPKITDISFGYSADGQISVDVAAAGTLPTLFLTLVGHDEVDVGTGAQTIRRPVDLAFVADNTTSLAFGPGGDVTDAVIDRSKAFVGKFNENIDRLSLVKFANGAEVPVPFELLRGFNKGALINEIDAFDFGSSANPQYTNSAEGFWRALDQIRSLDDPAPLKVIVFFTDGAPNAFASRFQMKDGSEQVGVVHSNDHRRGNPQGFYQHDAVSQRASDWHGHQLVRELNVLPEYYAPHTSNTQELQITNPYHPLRPVSEEPTNNPAEMFTRINRISRNLLEDMALIAREEGIYVFTLGLGSALTAGSGPDQERGEDILFRMANDPDMLNQPRLAGDFREDQRQGIYCHAVNEQALGPCFAEMLAMVIRLTH